MNNVHAFGQSLTRQTRDFQQRKVGENRNKFYIYRRQFRLPTCSATVVVSSHQSIAVCQLEFANFILVCRMKADLYFREGAPLPLSSLNDINVINLYRVSDGRKNMPNVRPKHAIVPWSFSEPIDPCRGDNLNYQIVAKGPITWRISARLVGLRFHLGLLNKSC